MLPTFPSRYWFTIGLPDVFSLAAWSPPIQTGFHVPRLTQVVIVAQPALPVRDCHPLRSNFPERSSSALNYCDNSYNPAHAVTHAVWALPLSLATTQGIDDFFLFLGVLRCFSSPRSPRLSSVCSLQLHGFPHSDISGSVPVCGSPELFAAYRVLLRHRKPRHPPFALLLFLRK